MSGVNQFRRNKDGIKPDPVRARLGRIGGQKRWANHVAEGFTAELYGLTVEQRRRVHALIKELRASNDVGET